MKKRNIFVLLLTLCLFMSENIYGSMILEYNGKEHQYTGNLYKLVVNDEEIKTPLEPIIFNDRALVPAREVFEATGAIVDYESKTRRITITGNKINIAMRIGVDTVYVSGGLKIFPDGLTPMLIAKKGESAKTMVPVRFISETLGYKVDFKDGVISITTNKTEPTQKPEVDEVPEKPTDENGEIKEDEDIEKEVISKLEYVYCKRNGDDIMITIEADEPIEEISKPILTASDVLYLDLFKTKSELPTKINVNRGAVTTVRTGIHEEYTRIALDTKDLKSYSVKQSKDKKLVMITLIKIPEIKEDEEKEKIVVIDAGHGGMDGGAGVDLDDGERINEKDINFAVAKKTEEILKNNKIKVEMTRSEDEFLELYERSAIANALDAVMFVSIHTNSATNDTANGIEVYYSKQNNGFDYGLSSKEVADEILESMLDKTEANNRRVKAEEHAVTRTSYMPAVLIEVGFITHTEERGKLVDEVYQDKLAEGISEGILKCLPKLAIPEGTSAKFSEDDLGNRIS